MNQTYVYKDAYVLYHYSDINKELEIKPSIVNINPGPSLREREREDCTKIFTLFSVINSYYIFLMIMPRINPKTTEWTKISWCMAVFLYKLHVRKEHGVLDFWLLFANNHSILLSFIYLFRYISDKFFCKLFTVLHKNTIFLMEMRDADKSLLQIGLSSGFV